MRIGLAPALAAALVCATATADPAIWHVEGPRGAELWLLGSMHLLRERDYPLPAIIDEVYERADGLVMELDLDDLDALGMQAALLASAVLPRGTALTDVVAPEVHAAAARRSAELGVDLALLERFEPWLVAITLLEQGMRRLGYLPEKGVEQYLVAKARRDGKEIVGLETPAEQLAIFDRLPPRGQEELLLQSLQELERGAAVMDAITAAWRNGELEILTEGLLADFGSFPGLYEDLVVDRNTAWRETFERLLTGERKLLIVVGALHLVGTDSVVDQLEKRGHRVSRLTPAARP